ncbi:Scr1 family TA system antitoxin-like transcriptional regulator [Streptomyces stelliscabiei]
MVQRVREPGERSRRHPALRTPVRTGSVADPRLRRRADAGRLPERGPEDVDRRVALRLRRQDLLAKPEAPAVWAILDETVLRRPVGGPEVMRAQIDRLAEATDRPRSGSRSCGSRPDPTPGRTAPSTTSASASPNSPTSSTPRALAGAQYVDQPADVVTYLEVLDRMSVQAEPVARTRDILAALRKEL